MMNENMKRFKGRMVKEIEQHLRHYKTYHVGIRNRKKQLEFIMPNMTANYDLAEGSNGTFRISSSTEKYAIDRIESRRALDLHEDIKRYELIISSIDEAMKELSEVEQTFVKYRYFQDMTVSKTARLMGYSEKHIFSIRHSVMDKLLISLRGLVDLRF